MNTDTSLDRFLRTRGEMYFGFVGDLRSPKIQIAIGAGISMIGLALVSAPVFGAPAEVAFGSIGPLIAGMVNVGVGLALKRKFDRIPPPRVNLTPEAKGLLVTLMRRIWRRQVAGNFLGMDGVHSMGYHRNPGRHGSWWNSQVAEPDPQTMESLERAASAYNRVAAVAEAGVPAASSLAKIVPKLRTAADDAMAELLHYGALMSKYPESRGPTTDRLQLVLGRLEELADRAESVFAKEPSVVEMRPTTSTLDDVLDELRLEGMARHELDYEPKDVLSATHREG